MLKEGKFESHSIWNMDETGVTNVHTPGKIIATKGSRQVSKVTSGERGKNITVICAMNAGECYVHISAEENGRELNERCSTRFNGHLH